PGRPRRGDPGTECEVAYDLVPHDTQSGLDHEIFARRPGILNVLRALEILAFLKRTAYEGHVTRNGVVIAQDLVIVALGLLVESFALEVYPELEAMRAGQAQHGQEHVGHHLLPVEVAVQPDEVIAAVANRRDLKEGIALRQIARDAARIGEADVE